MQNHELIPGVMLGALGVSERLMIGALRLIAAGRGRRPKLTQAFENHLGSQAHVAARGATILAYTLSSESRRKLTLGWLCVRGVTWDEAAILALLEAAQRSEPEGIVRWLSRLSIGQPSPVMQRGIAWSAAAFAVAEQTFDPDVANLTRASRSAIGQVREQIETQFGDRGV